MSGEASQLSVAVATPVAGGNVLDVHNTVTLGGQVICGAVESSTMIFCKHVVVFPQSSVALQVLAIEYSCGQDGDAVVISE